MKFVKRKSKKDCWKSGNVLPKVKKKWRQFSFRNFFSKNRFWRRKTQIGEDCLNVYVQSVKVLCRKCKKKTKKWQAYIFSPKKTFVLKQTSGLVKWCLCHSYQKQFFQNLTCSNCTKSGWKHTEKALTRF